MSCLYGDAYEKNGRTYPLAVGQWVSEHWVPLTLRVIGGSI